MSDRQEPTFSSQSSLNEDELADQPRRSQASAVRESINPRVKSRPSQSHAPAKKSATAGLALLLALVALGAGGFGIWQNMQFKSYAQTADQRIQDLESKLAVTGDESQESLAALQIKIKTLGDTLSEANSEIKKLWGVAYDTNRKEIASQKKSIGQIDSKTKKLLSSLDDQKTDITLINDLVEAQQAGMVKAEKLSKEAKQKADALETELKKLSSLESELNKRIAKNEEAVKAIDAFRLSVYKDINALKGTQ